MTNAMRATFAALLTLTAVALTAGMASAQTSSAPAAQQPQKLHGTIVSVQGTTLTFKADDGRTLTVDMTAVSPTIQKALTANERVTVMGSPGSDANKFTAQFIQQDSSDPSRGGTVVGQTPAAPAGPGTDTAWQRIHGTVGSVSGNTLSVKTDDGQTLTVDIAKVDAGIRSNLAAGEAVTVIGFYRLDAKKNVDKKNVEARFIQKDSGAGAASPKTTR